MSAAATHSQSSAPLQVSVEKADARLFREEIVSLYEQDGKTEFKDQFDWYYRDQGQETPASWLLRDGNGKIRGSISVTVRPLNFGGRRLRAGVAGNLIVDRTSGIYFGASSLVRAAQSLVSDNAIDVLLGVPNEFSQPVFRRLKFHVLDHWRTDVQVFRSRDLLRARLGLTGVLASRFVDLYAAGRRWTASRLHQITSFDVVELREDMLSELDLETWPPVQDRFVVASTTDYLEWRFLRHPSNRYQICGVRTVSGQLCGYIVTRHTAGRLWLVEYKVDPLRLTALEAIISFCRHSRKNVDTVWIAHLSSDLLSKELPACGFVRAHASMGAYPDYPLVGFWRNDHPLASSLARPSSWKLLPGFNDV